MINDLEVISSGISNSNNSKIVGAKSDKIPSLIFTFLSVTTMQTLFDTAKLKLSFINYYTPKLISPLNWSIHVSSTGDEKLITVLPTAESTDGV